MASSATATTAIATETATHLPLLPSARKKKLLKDRSANRNKNQSNKDGDKDEDNHQSNDDRSNQDRNMILHDEAEKFASLQSIINNHPLLSLPLHKNSTITTSQSQSFYEHENKHEGAKPKPPIRKNNDDKNNNTNNDDDTINDTTNQTESTTNDDTNNKKIQNRNGYQHQQQLQIKEEQLQTFASMSPLSASTTTNTVMHFMHTTIKYMNYISSQVEEKLELCENTIEDLEIKLSLVEKKLDSVEYVNIGANNSNAGMNDGNDTNEGIDLDKECINGDNEN